MVSVDTAGGNGVALWHIFLNTVCDFHTVLINRQVRERIGVLPIVIRIQSDGLVGFHTILHQIHGDGGRTATILVAGIVPLLVHAEIDGFGRVRVGAGHRRGTAVSRYVRGCARRLVSVGFGRFDSLVFGFFAVHHDGQVLPICGGVADGDVHVTALSFHFREVGFPGKLAI